MKHLIRIAVILLLITGLSQTTQARKPDSETKARVSLIKSRAADCAPATAQTDLELNNVRARIRVAGRMWQDEATSNAAYEIPKGSGRTAIYAGSLWMGGTDISGQLKLAAAMFGGGNDFWGGPLTTDGAAEIGPDVCATHDQFYRITKAEVLEFNAWWLCQQDPTCTWGDDNYTVPNSIMDWPAHGNVALGQDFYLAPFWDRPDATGAANGVYDPINDGDYPGYDLFNEVECQGSDRTVYLRGDETIWWVFNDKGNIHTESEGQPIGMEVKAQAFAFATNDEINNMTFYNYELINRGTQTLYDTYFAQWVDADVGFSDDDYVGCDVQRGLGYAYGGDAFDENGNGAIGYGTNPPAIGVDFFEGPYQDSDGKDNCLCDNTQDALADDGIVYEGIGIGYGDGTPDNERFGMRSFVYFNRAGSGPGAITDPDGPNDFYNYMRGIWKDGTHMYYGGDAWLPGGNPNVTNVETNYMFVGDSDPLHWATEGVDPGSVHGSWTEHESNTPPWDRRFLQSAGPFTLLPGAVNNLTVGVVYGRASNGNPFASVQAMRLADDKAQALFDNCFRIVDAPNPPELSLQELDRELIVTLKPVGNNVNEDFSSIDPTLPAIEVNTTVDYEWNPVTQQLDTTYTDDTTSFSQEYRFQGYQVFQLAEGTVGPDELQDPDRARLVFQCDIEDGISQLVNYVYDDDIGASVPYEMVEGEDEGLVHSFTVKEDLFAQGDRRLINHKTYYYMAIAYAHNNYKTYNPDDPQSLNGQKKPYLPSRISATGGEIASYSGIPHIPIPELAGTIQTSEYGDMPQITRIEGQGNGGLALDFTAESELSIVQNVTMDNPTYQAGKGPITVKVIDPLNVTGGNYILRFLEDTASQQDMADARWELEDVATGAIIPSERAIRVGNEQLFPELGFSVFIEQFEYDELTNGFAFNSPLESSIEYSDSSKQWLSGVPDIEGDFQQNWIRSGTNYPTDANTPATPWDDLYWGSIGNRVSRDADGEWENVLGGTWAPYVVANYTELGVGPAHPNNVGQNQVRWDMLQSVDVVITPNPDLWTRCPVFETGTDVGVSEGGGEYMELRAAPSVGKDGLPDGTGTGMGWFPGYAINLETGERLNMAFGEDSWLAGDNGRNMKWDPTDRLSDDLGGTPVFGGKHFVYVFNHTDDFPAYDEGEALRDITLSGATTQLIRAWKSCLYVGMPMVAEGEEFMSSTARVRLRVAKPYETYAASGENNSYPMYQWNMDDLKTVVDDNATAVDALALINVVPNPYYGYSSYETSRLDNEVKIVNLPDQCTISIYNMGGTLVRKLYKDNAITHVDWDLKNQVGIPISGGAYIIHVEAPGIGEQIIKWFGALRPSDTENF